jgi:signal transduction histidine kinase
MVREVSSGLPIVQMDTEKMRRVIVNIFDNAIYAVTAKQENLKNEETSYHPKIIFATFVSDDGVHIEVMDNGIGMDEETAKHSFEPLFTTRPRGTGLGLAIVKKVIEEHGGTVSLYSKINKGTKVTIVLPLL